MSDRIDHGLTRSKQAVLGSPSRFWPFLLVAMTLHVVLFSLPILHPLRSSNRVYDLQVALDQTRRTNAQPSPPVVLPQPEHRVQPAKPQPLRHSELKPEPVARETAVVEVQKSIAPAVAETVPMGNSELDKETASEGSASPLVGPVDFGSAEGPRFKVRVLPRYPSQAALRGKEGVVILSLFIAADGGLERVEVQKKAGLGFDEAAIKAVRQSTFHPAVRGGKAVPCQAILPIRFELKE